MSWGASEEALPDGDDAGDTIDDVCQAWWVRIRKFLGILVTDTSDVALGSGADEDNPKIKNDCVTSEAIADDAIDSEHYTAGSIDSAHLANGAVGANKLGNTASYQNARTRWVSVPFAGGKEGNLSHIEAAGSYAELVGAGVNDKLLVPIYVPHGATITNLYSNCGVYSAGTLHVTLNRGSRITASVQEMAKNSHSGTGVLNDSSIGYATVDNNDYAYFVMVVGHSSAASGKIYGVTITYTTTSPLM